MTDAQKEILDEFFGFLYDQQEGFVYLAKKDIGPQPYFTQEFFKWPEQRDEVTNFVLSNRDYFEVYMSPALYKTNSAVKENYVSSRVFWCEFDGNTPDIIPHRVPTPTLKIKSSLNGHEHWYWKTDNDIDLATLEHVNKSLTYFLEADTSGWDANQVLRPPNTRNHKRNAETKVLQYDPLKVYNESAFHGLPQPPKTVEIENLEDVPDIQYVLMQHKFSQEAIDIFESNVPADGDRSNSMMKFGYILAELNLPNNHILSMLYDLDARWGKFAGRSDQHKRLSEIVTIARQKHPYREPQGIVLTSDSTLEPESDNYFVDTLTKEAFTSSALDELDHTLNWHCEGILPEKAMLIISGSPGIGKTQLALNLSMSLAAGVDFLGFKTTQAKVGFLSLEMNKFSLKEFNGMIRNGYSDHDIDSNLILHPVGENIPLDMPEAFQAVCGLLDKNEYDVLIIDSLSAAVSSDLNDNTKVREVMGNMKRLINYYSCSVVFLHHNRKATSDNKKPSSMDDLYGSTFIAAAADTIIQVVREDKHLALYNRKNRSSKEFESFAIKRTATLNFTKVNEGISLANSSDSGSVLVVPQTVTPPPPKPAQVKPEAPQPMPAPPSFEI